MKEIKKLPSELINQIAAGEVIERPSSVVKELVDNSLDAGATSIKISIKNGGATLIEVADNGSGIPQKQLPLAFERHATSKVGSLEDLNRLMTMGFRGEALATVVAISKLSVISMSEDDDQASLLEFEGIEPKGVKPAARDLGTTVRVEDLFHNIPARKKFLKTSETEYRKILAALTPYFLVNPQVHFILEKDGRRIYNLPTIEGQGAGTLAKERLKDVIKRDFVEDMVPLFYDGDGVKISGYVAHPKFHAKRTSDQFMFINNRPVLDRGVYRAVHEGFGRFIPHGEKIPFVIKIDIRPDLVDVNVHPRKEEVRFINPYRLYSAVEAAVQKALERESKTEFLADYTPTVASSNTERENAFSRLRQSDSGASSYTPSESNASHATIQESLGFSKEILSDLPMQGYTKQDGEQSPMLTDSIRNAFQLFNKYIFLELDDELWVLDQHAAAERITFEKLNQTYDGTQSDIQKLLVPAEVELSPEEASFVQENKEFFEKIGFSVEVENGVGQVSSVPAAFVGVDPTKIFKSIFTDLTQDQRDLEKDFKKAKEDILATVACHSSIRTKQSLHKDECISLAQQLLQCDNPYSCPHGRPIVWRMSLSDIDKRFDRTY